MSSLQGPPGVAELLNPGPDGWSHRDRVTVPTTALDAAREIDDSAGPRVATPVRKSFVRSDTETQPPLSRLQQAGGRGGMVAIKLYLAVLWRCSGDPYETSKTARSWATLLGLPSPEVNGARRVAAATKALEAADLITVRRVPGQDNVIVLLDESGDGSPYLLPSNQWARAPHGPTGDDQRRRNTYFKIHSRWWTEGKIQSLEGPGLAMLLILLAEQAGEGKRIWFATTAFPSRYRISHKTRAAGTRELVHRGLLNVEREALPDHPGRVFERRRYRNVYVLNNPGGGTSALPPAGNQAG